MRGATLLALIGLLLVPSGVRAQGYIAPFAGYDFGGDSGCLSLQGCEDRSLNLGVGVGAIGPFLGFEQEVAWANDFFGRRPGQASSVLTVMSNMLAGPRLGVVQPYGLIGAGIVKTRLELTPVGLLTSDTSLAWNVGGGVIVATRHFGVRGDVRFLHAFRDLDLLGLPLPVRGLRLDFGRASAGLFLRF